MFKNQIQIKETNKSKIIQLVSKKRVLTKNEISAELGLSIPAVSSNIKELVNEGILFEAGQSDSSGGRKPLLIEFNPNYRYSVGVEFKEDYIRMIITNLDSTIIEEYYKKLESVEPENITDILLGTLDTFFEASSIDHSKISGIGFSIHGYVNDDGLSANIFYKSKIASLSFKEIQEHFGIPVSLQNNITLSALAESILGSSAEDGTSVYLYVNNGVGAGIITGNQVHQGHDKIAGAIGHMIININGKKCRCGSSGCWETYISKDNLIENYNAKSQIWIKDLHDFFNRLDAGDDVAMEVFNEYVAYLEIGLRSIVLMFNPDSIIIGGFLLDYFNYLQRFLNKQFFTQSTGIRIKPLDIRKSKLQKNASILGASLLPFGDFFWKI